MGSAGGIDLVVFMLADGACALRPDFDPAGRTLESGDLVEVDLRLGSGPESGVVLGVGANEHEAKADARRYLRRLVKWHGAADASEIKLFGQELSQTQQFLDGDVEDSAEEGS